MSVPQAELARERIRQAGLASRCRVEICDYREIEPDRQFDKLVSVGMFEHVGEALLPEYFSRAWRLLRPGGVFLNHGIAASANWQRNGGESFIEKYVFPDGELVPLNTTIHAAESCGFEVQDVENLRRHYEITLRHWSRRLQANAEEARRLTDDATYRTWRIYMAGLGARLPRGPDESVPGADEQVGAWTKRAAAYAGGLVFVRVERARRGRRGLVRIERKNILLKQGKLSGSPSIYSVRRHSHLPSTLRGAPTQSWESANSGPPRHLGIG